LGPAALLAYGVLLYVLLAWLARSPVDPFDRTLVLSVANLCLAAFLLLPSVRGGPILQNRTKTPDRIGWLVGVGITLHCESNKPYENHSLR